MENIILVEDVETYRAFVDRAHDEADEEKLHREKAKAYLKAAENYAKAHPEVFNDKKDSGHTERTRFWMEKDDPVLRLQPKITEAVVLQRLEADPACEPYVKKTYDREAIKGDFGGTKTQRARVEKFGLYFTEPQPHLKVAAL